MNNLYFIFIMIPVFLLIYIADKKKSKGIMILSVIILSLIIGMRGINVGIDTKDYYSAILNNFPKDWQFEEIGFRFISRTLISLFNNATIVFLIYAFVTNLLISLRLWDYKDKTSFFFSMFIYILIYMFSSMNIMRQFLAISITFYFSRYLEEKKYLLFFIVVFGASLIHKTALLTIFIPVLFMWNNWSKSKKIIAAIPLMFFCSLAIYYIFNYESNHIANYLSSDKLINNINITFIYRFLIFIISFFMYKTKTKVVYNNKIKQEKELISNENDKVIIGIIAIIYFIGLSLASLGMFYPFVNRIGLYFLIYEPVYWGLISNYSYNKAVKKTMIIIYALYVFFIEIFMNGNGIFPYYWNV